MPRSTRSTFRAWVKVRFPHLSRKEFKLLVSSKTEAEIRAMDAENRKKREEELERRRKEDAEQNDLSGIGILDVIRGFISEDPLNPFTQQKPLKKVDGHVIDGLMLPSPEKE